MAIAFVLKLNAFMLKHRSGLLAASCAGLFGANIGYHVFPKETLQTVYQAWSKGQLTDLSEKLHDTFQEVLEDVGVKSPKKYSAFAAFGFQPVSAGLPLLPSGTLVGIPDNFNDEDNDGQGIVSRVVMLNGKVVEWNSKEGASLREALSLSEEAKKFSLAREIVYAKDNSPLMHAAVAPTCLFGTCLSAVAIKQVLGLYFSPVLLRGIFNLVIITVGLVIYFFTYDAVNQWLDYRTDKNAATISKDYANGGVEFYNKILLRNKTLRHLMGKQGEEMYASSGNLFPKYWLRLKHASYTSRRDVLVNIMKDNQA